MAFPRLTNAFLLPTEYRKIGFTDVCTGIKSTPLSAAYWAIPKRLMLGIKHSQRSGFRTPLRGAIMITGRVDVEVANILKKAGAENMQDAKGLRPRDCLEAPLEAQTELEDTSRWIGDNEERYRLHREVIHHHLKFPMPSSGVERTQREMEEQFGGHRSWQIVPDRVSATPSELD